MPTLLQFPDAAVFGRAVEAGIVPADLAATEIHASPDDPLAFAVEEPLSRHTSKALGGLGVARVGRNRLPDWRPYRNWYQAAPPIQETPECLSEAMILVPAAAASSWSALMGPPAAERRTWVEGDRVALYSPTCPHHLLSRAADRVDGAVGYTQRSPGVWIELGYRHPFPGKLQIPQGKVVVLFGDRTVLHLDNWTATPPQGFQLRTTGPTWRSSSPPAEKISMTMKLVRSQGVGNEVPTGLWITPRDTFLDIVGGLDADLVSAFSVLAVDDHVIVRETNRRAVRRYWPDNSGYSIEVRGVPGLFVPHDRKLFPQLRRSVLIDLLGCQTDRIVWCVPQGDRGGFTTEYAPEASFTPLAEMIENSATAPSPLHHKPISNPFELETYVTYVTREDEFKKVVKKVPAKLAEVESKDRVFKKLGADSRQEEKPRKPEPVVVSTEEPATPSEAAAARADLVRRFVDIDVAPNHPDRIALWAPLAQAHRMDPQANSLDVHKCMLEAVWHGTAGEAGKSWLKWSKDKDCPDAYRLTAEVAHGVDSTKVKSYLDRLKNNFELMPVKAVWTTAMRLFESSGDVLGLARVRDSLLTRLHAGLSIDVDVPTFVRNQAPTGGAGSWFEDFEKLPAAAAKWMSGRSVNAPYVDLVMSWGAFRIGRSDLAEKLHTQALKSWAKPIKDPTIETVRDFVCSGYRHRIEQARHGLPHDGPLPGTVMAGLEAAKAGGASRATGNIEYYVQTIRQGSWLIEPQARADSLAVLIPTGGSSDIRKELAVLVDSGTGADIDKWVAASLSKITGSSRRKMLAQLLSVTPRASQSTAEKVVGEAVASLNSLIAVADSTEARRFGELASQTIRTAGHFGLDNRVGEAINATRVVASRCGKASDLNRLIETAIGPVVKDLVRLGLSNRINDLVSELEPRVTANFMGAAATSVLAACRLALGQEVHGKAMLDGVLGLLSSNQSDGYHCGVVAAAYASAVSWLPDAVGRFIGLLDALHAEKIAKTASADCFAAPHMTVLESMILGIVDTGRAAGKALREWLDRDEHLVRTRIHTDFAAFAAKHG